MAQALAEASLQFGPQRRDLHSALADAGRTRQNDVRAAQISGGALAHQIRQSLGPLSQDYRLAAQVGDVANNDVLNSLKGHPGADPYAAIIQGDRALGTELSARELANAKGSLRLQANQALQGAVNDVANVRSNYQSLAGKIRSQLTGLSADQSKFIAAEVPKIRAQMQQDRLAAQSAADLHRQRVASVTGIDPLTGLPTAKARAAGRGKNRLTITQSREYVGRINAARAWIARLEKSTHMNSTQIRALLASGGTINGKPHTSVTYSGTKDKPRRSVNVSPTQITVPAFYDPTVINAAYDLHVHGALSPTNRRALRPVRGIPAPWRHWVPPNIAQRGVSSAFGVVRSALRGLG